MRNLYAELGITPNATPAEVSEALVENPALKDSAYVLLHPQRRAIYDRVHSTLSAIGGLSVRMLSGHRETDFFREHPDFHPGLKTGSAAAAAKSKHKSNPRRKRQHSPKANKVMGLGNWAWVVLGAAIISYLYLESGGYLDSDNSEIENSSHVTTSAADPDNFERYILQEHTETKPQLTPVPMPSTGWGTTSVKGSGQNFINVRTSPSGPHTLVKVEYWDSGNEVATRIVQAGNTVKIPVPLGTFRIKTASGSTWYGPEHLFGPDTNYSVANSDFPLRKLGEYWEVELIEQTDGNLTQSSIPKSQF